jgi:thiol-disulfide isomerase/thioredoxin
MKSKNLLLVLAGFFVMLMIGAGILYGTLADSVRPETATITSPPAKQPAPQEGMFIPAPDFTVYDGEENPVKLSDYFGKPIVLNFWASWCGPCQMEMPHFEQAYLDLGEDVQFLMVNMTGGRETRKSAQDFLDEMGYTFPVLFDLDMDALYNYRVYSLPMTVFIDGAGNVQDMAIGAIDEATLLSKIALIYTE